MFTREEMMEFIIGKLENCDDLELEQYYWFFILEDAE